MSTSNVTEIFGSTQPHPKTVSIIETRYDRVRDVMCPDLKLDLLDSCTAKIIQRLESGEDLHAVDEHHFENSPYHPGCKVAPTHAQRQLFYEYRRDKIVCKLATGHGLTRDEENFMEHPP